MSMISPATVFTFNLGPITTLFNKPSINLNFIYSQGSSPPWNKDQEHQSIDKFLVDQHLTFNPPQTGCPLPSHLKLWHSPGFKVSLPLGLGDDVALHRPLADYIALLGSQPDPEDSFDSRIEKISKLWSFFCGRIHWTWRLTCEPRGPLG